MAKSKKEEEVTSTTSSIDILKSSLEDYKDYHYNDIVPSRTPISSGSLILDSFITVRSGNVVRLSGEGAETGKTSQSLVFAYNFMKTFPKGKTLYIKAEGRLSPELKARSGMSFVDKAEDWNYGTVFVLSTNIFEVIASVIEKLSKNMFESGEKLCVIWDSLDGTTLRADSEKDVWNTTESAKIAGVPLLTKILFRRLALPIGHYDVLLIILSQYSASISLNPYEKGAIRPVPASGGSAIMHQNDYTLHYGTKYQSDLILENPEDKPDIQKNRILGHYARVDIKKSSTDNSQISLRIPIKKGVIGPAIWVEKEVVDKLLAFNLLVKKGAWFSFDKTAIIDEAIKSGIEIKEKYHGLASVYEQVETDTKIFNFLLNLVKTIQ